MCLGITNLNHEVDEDSNSSWDLVLRADDRHYSIVGVRSTVLVHSDDAASLLLQLLDLRASSSDDGSSMRLVH